MSLELSNISTLLKVFKDNSNKIAITDTFKNKKITYKEFLDNSFGIQYELKRNKNIKPGDKI